MKRITIIAAAALILTGCSSPNEQPPTPTAAPTAEQTAEDYDTLGPDEEFAGDGKIGDTVELKYFDETETYNITVTKIETTTTIKNGGSNPDYDGGNNQYIDATPPDGKQFIHITYTIENTGNQHAQPGFDIYGYTDEFKEHAQSSEDKDITHNLNSQHSEIPYDGLNPGDKGELEAVISMPTTPTYISIADPSIDMRGAIIIQNK